MAEILIGMNGEMAGQVPRPFGKLRAGSVPAKNAGTRTGQPLDLRFYSDKDGQPAGRLPNGLWR
jgi:hypothetical protein